MQILTPCRETFGKKLAQPAWHLDPELALFDTILLLHPEILELVKAEVLALGPHTGLGRQDSPTVEQVLRAAIYKEVKGLTYPELEYHQYDSKVAAVFLQLTRPFSDSTWQKYIAAISAASLAQVLVRLNQIALEEGLEDLQKVRMDTTVVETDIHYPTNNSLLWDGIRTSTRILRQFDASGCGGTRGIIGGRPRNGRFRLRSPRTRATGGNCFASNSCWWAGASRKSGRS
jgi:IS5 family transposase